jgi:GNAT superfamily N-acetyltransferase
MLIRSADISDANAIAKVHVDSWRSTYAGILPDRYLASLSYVKRAQFWARILSKPNAREFIYVVEDIAGEVIGFASAGPERSGSTTYRGELYAIYLLERFQRQGIGRSLIVEVAKKLLEQDISSMLVLVLAENPSQVFYETLGGELLFVKQIWFANKQVVEVAYGWPHLHKLALFPQ